MTYVLTSSIYVLTYYKVGKKLELQDMLQYFLQTLTLFKIL